MAKKITVTINISERMLKSALKQADLKIVDKKAFEKLFTNKKFAKSLAADMLTLWQEANEEDSDALAIMMEGVVEYDDSWERGCVENSRPDY